MNELEEIKQEMNSLKKQMKKLKKSNKSNMQFFFTNTDIKKKKTKKKGIDNSKEQLEISKNDNENLKIELRRLEENIENLNIKNRDFETEISHLFKEKQILQDTINGDIITKVEHLFNSLSMSDKKSLDTILFGDKYTLFTSGMKNFNDLWNYAKYLNDEHRDDEFKILKEILGFFWEIYININNNIEKVEVELGSSFDSESMSRDNRSLSQNGRVEEVILFGYRTKKEMFKSIVRIA